MKAIFIIAAALFTSPLLGSESLEFVGYMTNANRSLFVLFDVEAKQNSLWVSLGQDWHGYTLKSFEPATEKLTVSKGMKDRVLSLRISKTGRAASVVNLAEGTYKLVDGTVVYSPEAQIKIGGNLVFSPTGVMVSDESQGIFAGDLTIETAKGTTQFGDAVLTVNNGGTKVTAKSVIFTPRPGVPSQSPNLTPKTVAPTLEQPASRP